MIFRHTTMNARKSVLWLFACLLGSQAEAQDAQRHTLKLRGKDYNHSTYCDLIITGLVGLRPQAGDTVVVNPLLPEDTWDFFCLDGVPYHGRLLTIFWDRTGKRYQKGKGLRVFADGREIAASATLSRIIGTLPEIPAESRSSRKSGK